MLLDIFDVMLIINTLCAVAAEYFYVRRYLIKSQNHRWFIILKMATCFVLFCVAVYVFQGYIVDPSIIILNSYSIAMKMAIFMALCVLVVDAYLSFSEALLAALKTSTKEKTLSDCLEAIKNERN